MSSRRSERPRKRPTPIDAHYEESLVSAALPRSASGSTTKMTDEPGSSVAGPSSSSVKSKSRGKARTKASRRRRVEEEDEMVHEGEGVAFEVEEDPPRSVTPEKKQDPEEDEDPVWQEFSQEYYEVVEQLPLEIHRNFALLRELDDQTQRQTGQLLELIRKYVVRRLPSPVPEELEVPLPLVGESIRAASEVRLKDDRSAGGETIKLETTDANAVKGDETPGASVAQVDQGDGMENGHVSTAMNGQAESGQNGDAMMANGVGPLEHQTAGQQESSSAHGAHHHQPQEPESETAQEPTIIPNKAIRPSAETQDPTDVTHAESKPSSPSKPTDIPPSTNVTPTAEPSPAKADPSAVDLAPTSVERVESLKARQAEMYAHRLVPAMASRDLLPEIGKLARDMLRSADEKVGIAIGTYNTVDRHIRSLDAALQAQQAALNLGIRQDTLPSKAVTGGTHAQEDPTTTLQTGAKADTLAGAGPAPPPRVGRNSRKGMKGHRGDQTRAVDALDVGLTTTVPNGKDAVQVVGEPAPIVLGYMAAHNFDLAIDPNEPRYCFCQNVSYGEMVGCENLDCPNGGWFHLGCLGMTSAPTGKWWCDQCKPADKASGQKRKKRKIKS